MGITDQHFVFSKWTHHSQSIISRAKVAFPGVRWQQSGSWHKRTPKFCNLMMRVDCEFLQVASIRKRIGDHVTLLIPLSTSTLHADICVGTIHVVRASTDGKSDRCSVRDEKYVQHVWRQKLGSEGGRFAVSGSRRSGRFGIETANKKKALKL